MVGFIFMVDEFRPDNGATRFVPRSHERAIRALAQEGRSVDQIYAALTVEDIRRTADLFRPVYDRLDGADGFVSLEVSPTSRMTRPGRSQKHGNCGLLWHAQMS